MISRKKILNAKFDKILDKLFWIEMLLKEHETDHTIRTANLFSIPITKLPLSTRTKNVLRKNNIRYFYDILNKCKGDFYLMKGLGKKGVDEIDSVLSNYYLSWKEPNN